MSIEEEEDGQIVSLCDSRIERIRGGLAILVQHAPGLKPRDRSLCPFFHQISRQPSRFSMRRVVAEEVSLSMPASVNDDKCEGDSK